jgi:hypothetical protein
MSPKKIRFFIHGYQPIIDDYLNCLTANRMSHIIEGHMSHYFKRKFDSFVTLLTFGNVNFYFVEPSLESSAELYCESFRGQFR